MPVTSSSATSAPKPTNHIARRHRGHRAAAVERDERQEVEQVEQEADVGERAQQSRCRSATPMSAGGRRRACRGSGRRARRAPRPARCRRSDFGVTTAPRNGDEHRRARLDALAAQLDHVAHLVHEQQHDEADRERPAEEQRVGGDGDERGRRRGQQLDLRQQDSSALAWRQNLAISAPMRARALPMRLRRTACARARPSASLAWRVVSAARTSAVGGRAAGPGAGATAVRMRRSLRLAIVAIATFRRRSTFSAVCGEIVRDGACTLGTRGLELL